MGKLLSHPHPPTTPKRRKTEREFLQAITVSSNSLFISDVKLFFWSLKHGLSHNMQLEQAMSHHSMQVSDQHRKLFFIGSSQLQFFCYLLWHTLIAMAIFPLSWVKSLFTKTRQSLFSSGALSGNNIDTLHAYMWTQFPACDMLQDYWYMSYAAFTFVQLGSLLGNLSYLMTFLCVKYKLFLGPAMSELHLAVQSPARPATGQALCKPILMFGVPLQIGWKFWKETTAFLQNH